jgi:predicted dehydrogenase
VTGVQTQRDGRRIGLVGIGKQGRKLADALMDLGYEVVGASDPHRPSLEKFRRKHPRIFLTPRIADLARVAPEVVVVATLADARLAAVRELEAIGIRRIFCEKPVVGSMADMRDLQDLVVKNSLNLRVNHVSLWSPDYATVKERLRTEQLGNLCSASLHFKDSGFGNMGCHFLAIALYLLDTRIASVESAFFSDKNPKRRRRGHEDRNGRATFLLENGAKLSLDNLPTVPPRVARFVFEFDRGRIESLHSSSSFVVWDGRKATISETSFQLQGYGLKKAPDVANRLLDRAIASLLEDELDGSFGLACQAVEGIIAAHHCFARNADVPLPLERQTETLYQFS